MENKYIKLRMGSVTYEQYSPDRFRVCNEDKVVIDTDNPAEAKCFFGNQIEKMIYRKINAELEAQGFNPITGKRITDMGEYRQTREKVKKSMDELYGSKPKEAVQ